MARRIKIKLVYHGEGPGSTNCDFNHFFLQHCGTDEQAELGFESTYSHILAMSLLLVWLFSFGMFSTLRKI